MARTEFRRDDARELRVQPGEPARCAASTDVRVDHMFSSRDRMFVRGSWMDFSGERLGSVSRAPASAAATTTSRATTTRRSTSHSRRRMSSVHRVVHEVRLGVNRLRTNKRPLGRALRMRISDCRSTAPSRSKGWLVSISAGALPYAPLGEFQFNPNDKTAGTFQLLDNLSIAEGTRTRSSLARTCGGFSPTVVGAQFARGFFNFNGRFTGSSFADFLLGMTSSRQFSTIQRGNLRERDYMGYVQDDWRIVPAA